MRVNGPHTTVNSTDCSTAYSDEQHKPLEWRTIDLCNGIHRDRWLVDSPHKGSVMWKACPYDDVISNLNRTVVLTSICKGNDINRIKYSINYLEQFATFLWRRWRSPSVSCDVKSNQISGITLNVSLSLSFRAVDHIVKISFGEVIDLIKHLREGLNLLWVTHGFGNSLIFVFIMIILIIEAFNWYVYMLLNY